LNGAACQVMSPRRSAAISSSRSAGAGHVTLSLAGDANPLGESSQSK
jgi:hypothetical protein